jgi:hypothetical protein
MSNPNDDIRLPLDLLLVNDVDTLEEALQCKYAVEHEAEIFFCRDDTALEALKEDLGDDIRYYTVDLIENDRIQAVIDLLNLSEENNYLGHLLDRIVR